MRHREAICLNCGKLYLQRRVGRAAWTGRQCPQCGEGSEYERVAGPNGAYKPGRLIGDGTRTDIPLKDVNRLRAPMGSGPCQA